MNKKKLLALLTSVVMMFSLAAPALAAEETVGNTSVNPEEGVVVLYTNDVHTYIDDDLTYSKVAACCLYSFFALSV